MTCIKTWLRKFDAWTLEAFNPPVPGYRGR
jgi:hypothetical protein